MVLLFLFVMGKTLEECYQILGLDFSASEDYVSNEDENFLTSLGKKQEKRQESNPFLEEEMSQFTRFASLKEQREANKKKFCDERSFSGNKCEQKATKGHKPKSKTNKQLKVERWKREKEISELAAQINNFQTKVKSQEDKKLSGNAVINQMETQKSPFQQEIPDEKGRKRQPNQALTNRRNTRKKKNRKKTRYQSKPENEADRESLTAGHQTVSSSVSFVQPVRRNYSIKPETIRRQDDVTGSLLRSNYASPRIACFHLGNPTICSQSQRSSQQAGNSWYSNVATSVPLKQPAGLNVWQQRQQRHEFLAELQPISKTDEELQLRIALELSKKQAEIDAQQREISMLERDLAENKNRIEKYLLLSGKPPTACDVVSCEVKFDSAAPSVPSAAHSPGDEDSEEEGEEWLVAVGDDGEETEDSSDFISHGSVRETVNAEAHHKCSSERESDEARSLRRAVVGDTFVKPSQDQTSCRADACPYGKNCCLGKRCKYCHPSASCKVKSDGSLNKPAPIVYVGNHSSCEENIDFDRVSWQINCVLESSVAANKHLRKISTAGDDTKQDLTQTSQVNTSHSTVQDLDVGALHTADSTVIPQGSDKASYRTNVSNEDFNGEAEEKVQVSMGQETALELYDQHHASSRHDTKDCSAAPTDWSVFMNGVPGSVNWNKADTNSLPSKCPLVENCSKSDIEYSLPMKCGPEIQEPTSTSIPSHCSNISVTSFGHTAETFVDRPSSPVEGKSQVSAGAGRHSDRLPNIDKDGAQRSTETVKNHVCRPMARIPQCPTTETDQTYDLSAGGSPQMTLQLYLGHSSAAMPNVSAVASQNAGSVADTSFPRSTTVHHQQTVGLSDSNSPPTSAKTSRDSSLVSQVVAAATGIPPLGSIPGVQGYPPFLSSTSAASLPQSPLANLMMGFTGMTSPLAPGLAPTSANLQMMNLTSALPPFVPREGAGTASSLGAFMPFVQPNIFCGIGLDATSCGVTPGSYPTQFPPAGARSQSQIRVPGIPDGHGFPSLFLSPQGFCKPVMPYIYTHDSHINLQNGFHSHAQVHCPSAMPRASQVHMEHYASRKTATVRGSMMQTSQMCLQQGRDTSDIQPEPSAGRKPMPVGVSTAQGCTDNKTSNSKGTKVVPPTGSGKISMLRRPATLPKVIQQSSSQVL